MSTLFSFFITISNCINPWDFGKLIFLLLDFNLKNKFRRKTMALDAQLNQQKEQFLSTISSVEKQLENSTLEKKRFEMKKIADQLSKKRSRF
jgi:hypothetical protein